MEDGSICLDDMEDGQKAIITRWCSVLAGCEVQRRGDDLVVVGEWGDSADYEWIDLFKEPRDEYYGVVIKE